MNRLFEFQGVDYVYSLKGNFQRKVIRNLSAEISSQTESEVISVFAHPGSGKTSLLKLLSGIIEPSNGKVITKIKQNSGDRYIPYIPNVPSSLSWLSVEENVGFGLSRINPDKTVVEQQVQKALEITGLDGYEKHYPLRKSLGFRFRIALARAIAVSPWCILVDEPYTHLDREMKEEINDLLTLVSSELKMYIIIATSQYIDGIAAGSNYYWLENNECSTLQKIAGADNLLSMIK